MFKTCMFRFLPGIILVQAATIALVLMTLKVDQQGFWIAAALMALILGLVTAFWFGSISDHIGKDSLVRVQEKHARDRERLRVKAEKDKTKVIEQSHRQIAKATSRAHAKANFKVGAAFAAAVGAGVLMLFTQFLTIGLLTLTTAGGALVGYGVRARQELAARKKKIAHAVPAKTRPVRVIEAKPAVRENGRG
jgi:hypothetical protein